MRVFSIKPPVLFLVLILLGAIVWIVILPQVDLPATAFHRNTSPLALRAQSTPHAHPGAAAGFFREAITSENRTDEAVWSISAARFLRNPPLLLTVVLRC